MRFQKGDFEIDDDRSRLDRAFLVQAIQGTYWGRGFEADEIQSSFDNAVPFGLYERGGRQIGCARVVTDSCRFAWLSDVFVDPAYRGLGLGRWLTATILDHSAFRPVTRWVLATTDAHALYREFGFQPADPGRIMVLSKNA